MDVRTIVPLGKCNSSASQFTTSGPIVMAAVADAPENTAVIDRAICEIILLSEAIYEAKNPRRTPIDKEAMVSNQRLLNKLIEQGYKVPAEMPKNTNARIANISTYRRDNACLLSHSEPPDTGRFGIFGFNYVECPSNPWQQHVCGD